MEMNIKTNPFRNHLKKEGDGDLVQSSTKFM